MLKIDLAKHSPEKKKLLRAGAETEARVNALKLELEVCMYISIRIITFVMSIYTCLFFESTCVLLMGCVRMYALISLITRITLYAKALNNAHEQVTGSLAELQALHKKGEQKHSLEVQRLQADKAQIMVISLSLSLSLCVCVLLAVHI